jgi:hypothetical protein
VVTVIVRSLVWLILIVGFSFGCYLAYWLKGYILLPILPAVKFEKSEFSRATSGWPKDVFKQLAMLKDLEQTNRLKGCSRATLEEMLLVKPFEKNSRNPYRFELHGNHAFYAFDTYGLDVEYEHNVVKQVKVVGMLCGS